MHYFTPAKTLPEGTIYLTDLTHVAAFAAWLAPSRSPCASSDSSPPPPPTPARHKAEAYAIPYFDFQRMTALAVGNPWRTASDAQKQALTKEFQTLLIRTYSGTMLKFKNANVNVKDNPVVNKGGKEIIVRAEVSVPGQKPVNMDFTTYQSGNKYRAYNVAIEGASLVTVYRNQFGETIKAKGVDGLIAELKAKNGSK